MPASPYRTSSRIINGGFVLLALLAAFGIGMNPAFMKLRPRLERVRQGSGGLSLPQIRYEELTLTVNRPGTQETMVCRLRDVTESIFRTHLERTAAGGIIELDREGRHAEIVSQKLTIDSRGPRIDCYEPLITTDHAANFKLDRFILNLDLSNWEITGTNVEGSLENR